MKSSKLEVQKRVDEILTIRLQGAEWADIREYAADPERAWGVSDTQLRRYIAAGDKLLADTLEKDRGKLVNRHHAQRRALYARAVNVGDLRTALAIVKDEAELLGLYPTGKDQHTKDVPLVTTIEVRESIVYTREEAQALVPPS